ncbi:MAG: tetratricopeptide repeat protein, partial [Candidatus Poribacteria bacterium]|nr:tetratricopeptide repeat protein [Candidatus Poribacteria bacterium]
YQLAIENTDDVTLKAEIQYEIGDNYMEAKDFASAATAYRVVFEVYPTSQYVPAARYGVGEAYMSLANSNTSGDTIDRENFANARAAYQEVLNEHPGSEYESHATFNIGEAYYQTKDYEDSLQWYETVMDRYPEDPLAPYALYGALWSLSDLGRNDEVLARGRAFIEANMDNPDFDLQASEIQMKLGDIMFEAKDFQAAAEEYGRVLSFEDLPKFYAVKLRSYYQQGVAYFQLGEHGGGNDAYAKAIPPLNEAVAKYSDNVFNFDYDFPERITFLENSILNKAHVHEKLSQWAEARAAYALIKTDSENYPKALVLIAEAYEKEKNIDQAINNYRAISQNTALGETWQSLGAIRLADLLRGEERWQEAADAYAGIVTQYPTSEYVNAAQYLVGVCYYSMEPRTAANLANSIAAFQVVLDTAPNSDNAPDALYGMTLSVKTLAEQGSEDWRRVITLADQLVSDYGSRTDARAQKAVNAGNLLKVFALEKLGEGGIEEMVASLTQVVMSESADEQSRVSAQLKIGNLYFEAERYEESMPAYEKLGDLFPQNEHAALGYYQAAVSAYRHGENVAKTNENAATPFFRKADEQAGKALTYQLDNNLIVSVNYTRGLAQSKTGNLPNAIESLKKVTALEGQVSDPQRVPLVEAAFIELAKLYVQMGQFNDAAASYETVAAKSANPDIKSRALLQVADIYENQLGDMDKAVENYLSASEIAEGAYAAQALYRSGILLAQQYEGSNPKNADYATRAIAAFEALQDGHADSENSNVQLMVADGGVRASDLYVKTGNVTAALERAITARDRALQTNDVVQRVQAQYQVANLKAQRARAAFDSREGATNTAYRNQSRDAVQEYLKVLQYGEPVEQAPQNARVFIGPAVFQAGAISYSLHGMQDLEQSSSSLPRYVSLVDNGIVTSDDETLKTALYYTGVALYDLARTVEYRDGNRSADAYARSAAALQRLVDRYSTDKDAGLWHFQVGEAYFAAERWQEALKAYLAMAKNHPKHASAAEAIYSAAACYNNLNDAANVFATYERIAKDYPTSDYAAEAFLTVGDARYNQSIDLQGQAKIARLEEAITHYRRASEHPSAQQNTRSTAAQYMEETSELVASLMFEPMEQRMNNALSAADQNAAVLKSIAEFKKLIADYPKTSSAQIAWTKVGDAYVAIEQWQQALDAYNALLMIYVDRSTGREMTPGDEFIARALTYARQQFRSITTYVQTIKTQN